MAGGVNIEDCRLKIEYLLPEADQFSTTLLLARPSSIYSGSTPFSTI
jgi:hypothetical protein